MNPTDSQIGKKYVPTNPKMNRASGDRLIENKFTNPTLEPR